MNVGKLESRMLCRLLERYQVVKVMLSRAQPLGGGELWAWGLEGG